MKKDKSISILFPYYEDIEYKQLSPTTCHDLALDELCKELTDDKKEQRMIMSILSNMTSDKRVAYYRQKVFEDILRLEYVRKRMTELFNRIEFLKSFGTMKRSSDEKLGIWGLLHRLDELGDYIKCIEAMRECLSQADIRSEGLIAFRKFVDTLYEDSCFSEMKEDIANLKIKTSDIKSVTVGINLNDKFEAVSIGLVSVNKKSFKKSGVLSNFVDAFALKNSIKNDTEWNGNMSYYQAEDNSDEFFNTLERNSAFYSMQTTPFIDSRIVSTVSNIPEGDELKNTTFYLEKVTNKLLDNIVKKLNEVLSKYVNVSVINISKVMPEFLYYIKFAEFIEKNTADNLPFCEPELIDNEESSMITKDFYNYK